MPFSDICQNRLSKQELIGIIQLQTDLTKLGPDLGSVMSLIAFKAQETTKADGATIELAENGKMVYRAVSGSLNPFLGLKLDIDGSLSGLCVKTNEMLYSKDTRNDTRVDKASCVKVNATSMIVMPLKHEGVSVGVLKVVSGKPSAFDDTDICKLKIIAEIMASLMYHAIKNTLDELFHKASHDSLTGLHNTSYFYEHLLQLITVAGLKKSKLGIAVLDMDGLKYINDTFGHKAGDIAIKEFATRLKTVCRESDIVARIGGDEFGVILSDIHSKDECKAFMDRLFGEVEKPLVFEENILPFGVSVGYSLFPDDSEDSKRLVEIADKSMYAMKKDRKTNK